MNTYPMDEVQSNAEGWMNEGFRVYQQFNCGRCGAKQTIDVADKFFTKGKCEECGHVTDIRASGCNFMAIKGDR